MNQCEHCGEPLPDPTEPIGKLSAIVIGRPPRCQVCFHLSPAERRSLRLKWEIREYLRRLVEKP